MIDDEIRKRKAERDAARVQLQKVSNAIRVRKWNEKKNAMVASDTSTWVLTPALRTSLLVLYDKNNYDPKAAAEYLISYAEKKQWPRRPVQEVERIVEDVFLSTPDERFNEIAVGQFPHPRLAMAARKAHNTYAKWQLKSWVTNLNKSKGVAVSRKKIVQKMGTLNPDLRLDEASYDSQRAFAARLRRLWNGKWMKLRAKMHMTNEEMRSKAYHPL